MEGLKKNSKNILKDDKDRLEEVSIMYVPVKNKSANQTSFGVYHGTHRCLGRFSNETTEQLIQVDDMFSVLRVF